MSETVTPFTRGGMCSNPFGGEDRIDRINLLEFLQPNTPPEKVLFSCVIQDAASNYLYAFLGKNGTSVEEFFSAWQYFFKVTSANKVSWDHNRTIKLSYNRRGQRVVESRYLTDSELQLMCFDQHYEMSGLSDHMHIDKFRAKLKEKRHKILSNNWEQVQAYVNSLYQHELSQIADRQQVPLQIWSSEDLLSILIDPPTPLHLANTIYVSNKLKRPRRSRANRQLSAGIYAKLVERLEGSTLQDLDPNWGPLAALLEGAANDQVICDDSGDRIPCDSNRCLTTALPSDSR